MGEAISDSRAAEIEKLAARLAGEAGAILRRYFGTGLGVEYKVEKQHDPVTVADREAQEHVAVSIAKHYPDHGFVGEEDRELNPLRRLGEAFTDEGRNVFLTKINYWLPL